MLCLSLIICPPFNGNPLEAGILSGNADLELGQIDFTHATVNFVDNIKSSPVSVAIDTTTGKVFVADAGNSRVLWWNNIGSLTDGSLPDGVLGQPDFYSNFSNQGNAAPAANTLNSPMAVFADGAGRLWTADTMNRRVLRYSPPFSTNMNADLVLGQTDFISGSFKGNNADTFSNYSLKGVFVDAAGNVWVADWNRVLRFSAPITNGMSADLVLGQQYFNYYACNTNPAGGAGAGFLTPNAKTLCDVSSVFVDGSSNVWVADGAGGVGVKNSRVLRYSPPFSTYMDADLVLGQPDFTSNGTGLTAATFSGDISAASVDAMGNVWAADRGNNRLLRFSAPAVNGASADLVLGQEIFTSSAAGTTASTLRRLNAVLFDAAGNLWAADSYNHRLLRYPAPFSSGMGANLVLGQADFVHKIYLDGKGFDSAGSIAVDVPNDRVFAADGNNNRILWWNGISGLSNGKSADGVLGQPDLNTSNAWPPAAGTLNIQYGPWSAIAVDASGAVWAADFGNNRVLRYSPPFTNGKSADLVLGQPDFNSGSEGTSASTLWGPFGVAVDIAGRVWVGDDWNSRVLRYSPPFTNGKSADLVLGQPDFNSSGPVEPNPAVNTLFSPYGVAVDTAGHVWVADGNNRVLRYSPPFSNGMNADLALGQQNFTSSATDTAAAALNWENAVAADAAGNIWVADSSNNRALRFSPPFSTGMSANLALGQPVFTSSAAGVAAGALNYPNDVKVDSLGNIWIADTYNHRFLKFNADIPANLAGSALGVSSIAWTWNSVAGATGYNFYPSTGGAPIALAAASLTQTGLFSDTAYGARVSATTSGRETALSAATTAYTLPATRVWDGGGATNNASEAANWTNNTAPQNGESVLFDGTNGTKYCNWDIAGVSLSSFTLAVGFSSGVAASAALDINGHFTIADGTFIPGQFIHTVAGDWTQSGGYIVSGLGFIKFDGTSLQQLSQAGVTYFPLRVLVQSSNIVRAASNLEFRPVRDISEPYFLRIQGGTFEAGASTLTFRATPTEYPPDLYYPIYLDATGSFLPQTSTVVLDGTALVLDGFMIADSLNFNNLVVGLSTAVAVQLTGPPTQIVTASSLKLLGGLFDVGGNGSEKFVVNGSVMIGDPNDKSRSATFQAINGSTITISGDLITVEDSEGQINIEGSLLELGGNLQGLMWVNASTVTSTNPGAVFCSVAITDVWSRVSDTVIESASGVTISSYSLYDHLSNVTFRNLQPGATAITYTLVSGTQTWSGLNFSDASIGTNIYAPNLAAPGFIALKNYSGPRAGSAFENDPNGRVFWAGPAAPALSGTALGVSSIAWSWNNVADEAGFRVISSTDGSMSGDLGTDVLSWIETGLSANTAYTRRVAAFNALGASTSAALTRYTLVPSALGTADPGSGGTVVFNPPAGEVRLEVPPQTFQEAVTITVQVPASFPSAASAAAELKSAGVGIEILLDKSVQPARDVYISVSYRDSDVAGLDEDKLILARYDAARNLWTPLVSIPDPANNRIKAKTSHFSVFQVMQAVPSATVSTARAFPNPFRPSQGHTSMTFAALPAGAEIKIYTLIGQLVKNLTADAAGMASWDATNRSGQKAASGVYFVYVQGAGEKRTFKVIIQR